MSGSESCILAPVLDLLPLNPYLTPILPLPYTVLKCLQPCSSLVFTLGSSTLFLLTLSCVLDPPVPDLWPGLDHRSIWPWVWYIGLGLTLFIVSRCIGTWVYGIVDLRLLNPDSPPPPLHLGHIHDSVLPTPPKSLNFPPIDWLYLWMSINIPEILELIRCGISELPDYRQTDG